MTLDPHRFWERAEQVERFADREPDHRLLRLLEECDHAEDAAVLDLGCAAGRNTELLARRGIDVHAVDASRAMVSRTRKRVAEVLGQREARRRVVRGTMDDLGTYDDGSFRLVVALGVYHNAASEREWRRALEETRRVLAPGGRVLVSNFTPETDPNGSGLVPVRGARHVYRGFESGPLFLLEAGELDAEMVRHGLFPVEPTETVRVEREPGRRVIVNGLYRKRRRPADPEAPSGGG